MTVYIFDCTSDRRSNLASKIRNTGHDVVAKDHVWDTDQLPADPKPDPGDVEKHFWSIEDDSVVFVHRNNQRQHYWADFLDKKCGGSNWVIMYSGEGLSVQSHSSKHFAYPDPVGTNASPGWQLDDFLESLVGDGIPKPFDVLLGVDPILEAKLNLLHKLLVPPEEQITSEGWQELEEWNEFNEAVQEDSEELVQPYEEAWEGYQQAWESLKDDLGDEEGWYEKALERYQQSDTLEEFRDALFEST